MSSTNTFKCLAQIIENFNKTETLFYSNTYTLNESVSDIFIKGENLIIECNFNEEENIPISEIMDITTKEGVYTISVKLDDDADEEIYNYTLKYKIQLSTKPQKYFDDGDGEDRDYYSRPF